VVITRFPGRRACLRPAAAFAVSLLTACGSSSVPNLGAGSPLGPSTSPGGPCTGDVGTDTSLQSDLLPSTALVQQRQEVADQYGGGFRIAANAAEIGYIHELAQELTDLGATEVSVEPYTFTAWSPKTTSLEVVQGPSPGPVNVAYFIPSSGSTGPQGLQGSLTYFSALSEVNLLGAVYQALDQQNLGNVLTAVQEALSEATAGGLSLAQAITSADVAGKIVMYDAPKLEVPIGVFEAISTYYNNSSGTMGPTTPYSRPFLDQLLLIGVVDKALAAAGAKGIISVVDWPPAVVDNDYVPFGGLAIPAVPGLYLDRYTGAALEKQVQSAGLTAPTVKLTLDADQGQATSYNISALVPGQCSQYILVSSHSDGPNSVEDNGPAAILSIADYFLHAPASQRKRGLKIVLTGGHLDGSPGIVAYIKAHQAELTADAMSVIEIEHLGAREWVELSPGTMGLDGLPEPQVIYAGIGSAQQQENVKFAEQFDRSLVTVPLPFGEGDDWASNANLPKTQFITGPVYLLNGPFPEVSSEFTDYDLERRQIGAFIQMILDYNTMPDATLKQDQNLG
jgi:hypothetical protein